MLLIQPETTTHLLKAIRHANSVDAFANLMSWLERYDKYGIHEDDSPDEVIVELAADLTYGEKYNFCFVIWKKMNRPISTDGITKTFPTINNDTYERWMVGGLIYNQNTQTWSSHT